MRGEGGEMEAEKRRRLGKSKEDWGNEILREKKVGRRKERKSGKMEAEKR
jgi:hypothetical protein